MALSRAGEFFDQELHRLLDRVRSEWELTVAEAVGILNIAAVSIAMEAMVDDDEEEEEEAE